MNQAEMPSLPRRGQVQGLVFYPSENLLTKSVEIPSELVPSEALHEIAQNLTATMLMTGGVGISAIQVGIPWRVIALGVTPEGTKLTEDQVVVMVNPMLIEKSDETVVMEEGCLSFPNVLQDIRRHERVVVSYLSPDGDMEEMELTGWASRCVQHECDHLDGVLFTERMGRVGRRLAQKQVSKLSKAVQRDGKKKSKKKPKKRRKR